MRAERPAPTRYGVDEHGKNVADYGWDEACVLNCDLYRAPDLVRNKSGRVVKIDGGPVDIEGGKEVQGG